MDLHQRQPTWLVQVAYLPRDHAVKTIQNHWKIVHELPLAKTVNLGNNPINIICRMGMVIHLYSNHFQALSICISTLYSTWRKVPSQPPAQAKDIQVNGHGGKDMTSTKVVVVLGRKGSPLRRFEDQGRNHQVHRECQQDRQKFIQPIGQHLAALILHLNLLLAQLRDPWVASKRNYTGHQRNCGKQMLQGLQSCLRCHRWPTTIMLQMMRRTIRRTWSVQPANLQSACSKLNSPWRNLPKGWGRPTIVPSTSGRKYGWLCSWRRSIGP